MILQLNPSIPVITPKGKAIAHAIIDSGIENNLQWVCFQDSTGECWTWSNPQIRAQINVTQGRNHISPFYNLEDVAFKKEGGYFCMECKDHNECTCEEGSKEKDFDHEHEYITERVKNVELRQENNGLKESIKQLTELLGKLYNEDQVHPNQREEVRVALLKTDEYMDGHYGRVMRKKVI